MNATTAVAPLSRVRRRHESHQRDPGREVWVGSNATGIISVIDAATGTVSSAAEGFGWPYRVLFSPDIGRGVAGRGGVKPIGVDGTVAADQRGMGNPARCIAEFNRRRASDLPSSFLVRSFNSVESLR